MFCLSILCGMLLAAAPSGVTVFPNVSPSIPFHLTLVDSIYGDFDLVWDQATLTWSGCKVVSFPGNLAFPPASTPVKFTLFGDSSTTSWSLVVFWCSSGSAPRDGATCGDPANEFFVDTVTFRCPGETRWGRSAGNLYAAGYLPTWTITIP